MRKVKNTMHDCTYLIRGESGCPIAAGRVKQSAIVKKEIFSTL